MHLNEAALHALAVVLDPEADVAHLRSCEQCTARLQTLRAAAVRVDAETLRFSNDRPLVSSAGAAKSPESLARLGPYILLAQLGEGGMGTVYEAYHRELDRKVAIKLLRAELRDSESAARMLREAQAMARLDHPNVVGVHDVGQQGDSIYLVMDKVEGGTLKQWLETPRTWREIVAIFMQAGRGLAAAHAAGIVHRDFKPANVLMSADGRARVSDFGLAKSVDEPVGAPPPGSETFHRRSSGRLSSQITLAGTFVGTPRYMAPEQFIFQGDQRSDQFGFCVALYEALYGETPYEARALAAQPAESTRDPTAATSSNPNAPGPGAAGDRSTGQRGSSGPRLRDPPRDRRVPRFVRRALIRGLSQAPTQRFESMEALLLALSKDPARRLARVAGAAAVTAIVVAGIASLFAARQSRRSIAGCGNVGRELVGVWDDQRRQTLRAAFERASPATAALEASTAIRSLDDYASSWTKLRASVCESVVSVSSDESSLLELSCLGRERTEFQALADELVQADADIVAGARSAMGVLQPPNRCTESRALAALPKPPGDPRVRSEVDKLRRAIASARVRTLAGKPREATQRLEGIMQKTEELQYRPLVAEALYALAYSQFYEGDEEKSEETEMRAENEAEAAGADVLAASAAANLSMDMVDIGRLAEGHRWLDRANALLVRMGGDPQGDALAEDAAAQLAASEGRDEDTISHAKRAHELLEKAFGADHPLTLHYLAGVGQYYGFANHEAEAFETLAQAIEKMTRILGDESVDQFLPNIIDAAAYTGQFDDGERYLALGSKLTSSPPKRNSLWYANILCAGADLRNMQHRPEEALAMARQALPVAREASGPTSLYAANCLAAEGDALEQTGDHEKARKVLSPALQIFEKAIGPKSDTSVRVLKELAKAELGLGRAEKALPLAERALALKDGHQAYAGQLAEIRFTIAQALASSQRDPGRAAFLGSQARAELQALPWKARELRDVDAWLSVHSGN